ncbi:uncharacterized protein METZ01_LOCUS402749, partial [marine metagenome]
VAIPSGSGSEVLKSSYMEGLTNSTVVLVSTTDHDTVTEIVTILSVVVCEMGGNTDDKFNMFVHGNRTGADASSSPHEIQLVKAQPIGAGETFVFSDKIVLWGGDSLRVNTVDS